MQFNKRLRLALRTLFSKSARETIELNNLYSFLGIDPSEKNNVLSEATYYACLKVLSEAVGKLPLKLPRYNDKNGVETAREHPLYKILNARPNPYMTASTFWSTVEQNRNHWGNAYVWIKGAGKDMTLWILPSDRVEMWVDDANILPELPDIFYRYSDNGQTFVFGSEEILHFKSSNTLDGVTGISVQDQLRMTIDSNYKAQKLIGKMYDNGFTGKAVLQYTGNLNEANQKSFTKGIQKYLNGELKSEGIENIIPLPFGATLQPLNLKLSDNQFFEVKQYTALQIASAFGIKPYQIGDYTKSSYASAEAQQLSFYVDTLLYILKQYEEELTYKLLSDNDIANGYHFKFNVAVILRADLKTQIDTLSTAVSNFIYTPNEARAKLDLEAKPGGDRLLGNGASIPVELTGSQYTKTEQEETPPDPKPEDDVDENDDGNPDENNEGGGQDNA